jgi:hypothetical protein
MKLSLFSSKTLCLVITILIAPFLHAQENSATSTPPSPPYFTLPSGDYTLVEKITYKSQPAAAPSAEVPQPESSSPDLKELDLTKSGQLRKDRQVFVDGSVSEIWRSGALRIILRSSQPDIVLIASKTMSNYDDPVDFKELAWLDASTFSSEQDFEDRKCYVYKKGDQTAWVDKSTRFPLFLQSKSIQVSYAFGVPSTPLQLPPNVSKKIEQSKRAWAGLPN